MNHNNLFIKETLGSYEEQEKVTLLQNKTPVKLCFWNFEDIYSYVWEN